MPLRLECPDEAVETFFVVIDPPAMASRCALATQFVVDGIRNAFLGG